LGVQPAQDRLREAVEGGERTAVDDRAAEPHRAHRPADDDERG
jgi:hypothetical protein